MSWQEAKTEAQRIYDDLRARHDHGFAGMVLDALRRLHARDRGQKQPAEPTKPNEQKGEN